MGATETTVVATTGGDIVTTAGAEIIAVVPTDGVGTVTLT